ncbi:hypothetical protein [Lysobacter gummosus]|uniref:Lipoprotein n=1 Tax=Lysobacter gummosus TaxID=262324 RepID=A0ABY3XEZ7_9GAMM|nr:hypothetical protein [Lysobacter gummosus]ALN89567.1 hypothetical protein LG3211_0582 [Lysobacter gummosus]UNP30202.1 hypothetical protein MOV92_02675 [Lysobacter gummosus]
MFMLWKAPVALAVCLCAMAAGGCATFRGAPQSLVTPKQLESKSSFKTENLIEDLVGATSESQRTLAATKLMAVCDIRYMEFRHEIVANRKHSRAASNALSLMTDVAASLTDSAGVKNNYIALSVLIQGGNNIYDKDYMFDRTLDALVAQMDANRKTKLLDIRRAMTKDIVEYPGPSALADVIDYYHAGTINGAILGVQKAANEQEQQSMVELRELEPVTQAEIAKREADTDWVGAFVDKLDKADLDKLDAFIKANGDQVASHSDDKDRLVKTKQAMNRVRKNNKAKFPDIETLKKELKKAGLPIDT